MTTPNLATVAIRPLRRPTTSVRTSTAKVPAFRVPVYLIGELLLVAGLLYVVYLAVTQNWLGIGIGAFVDWYTSFVAPHFDLPLTVRSPWDVGPVGQASSVFGSSPFA